VDQRIKRVGILTNTGTTSKRVAEKYRFSFCASREDDVFDEKTNTIFVATRHDSHAKYVLRGLQSGKNVFVEKPICLTEEELTEIEKAHQESGKSVMIGFNRRFSPLVQQLKKKIGSGAMSMIYRVNAGSIPKDSWIQDLEIGGGRIIGEACHFIDLLTFINGSVPKAISAIALPDPNGLNDTVSISIQFENGSIGTVAYFSNGSKELPKEYLEVYHAGSTVILKDFKEVIFYGKGRSQKKRLFNQNKGQKEMVEVFLNDLLEGKTTIPAREIFAVTQSTFLVLKSIQNKGAVYEL
jgi:predicted dehydrogenase